MKTTNKHLLHTPPQSMCVCAVRHGVEAFALWSNVTTMQHDSRIISENNFVNFLEQFNHSQSRRAHQQRNEKNNKKNTQQHNNTRTCNKGNKQQTTTVVDAVTIQSSYKIYRARQPASLQRLFIFTPLPRQRSSLPWLWLVLAMLMMIMTIWRCCADVQQRTSNHNESFSILWQCSSSTRSAA